MALGLHIHAAGVLRSLWSEPRARGFVRDRESLRANRLSFAPKVQAEYSLPPRPAKYTHATGRALRKLVVRKALSLDSEVCGCVEAGRRVRVLEQESRLGRILIAADFVEGVQPLGWVTVAKDGEVFMSIEQPQPLDAMLNCSPKAATSANRSPPTRSQETLLRHRGVGPRRAGIKAKNRGAASVLEAAAGGSAHRFRTQLFDDSEGAAHAGAEGVQQPGASDGPGRSSGLGGLLSSQELRSLAEAQLALAAEREAHPPGISESFAARVGRVIVSGGHEAGSLATAWDRNKHNAVNRFDFCVGLRQLLEATKERSKETNSKKEREDMEALFDSLDLDHSGELDLEELKAALVRLAKDAQDAETAAARHLEQTGARIRAVAASFEQAAARTAEYEEAERALWSMHHAKDGSSAGGASLRAQIGAVLMRRNLRVGDVLRDWDEDNSGTIDADEWYVHLRQLGIGVSRHQSDEFFGELDGDGDGELTMEELRKVLKALSDAANKQAADEKAATKLVGERRRGARSAQAQAREQALGLSSESFKRGPKMLSC